MEPEAVTEAAVAPVVTAVAVSAAVVHAAAFSDAEFVGGDDLACLRVHEPELPAEITLKPYGDPRNVMISR